MELVLKASPKKAKALAEKKVLFTKKDLVRETVANEFASKLNSLKSNSKARKYFGTTLNVLKKYKLGRLASTTLGTNRKAFAHKTTKILGRPQVTLSVMRTIAQCYEDYSTQLHVPDKKRVSKKTGLPTKILDRPIDQVWKQFRERNPDLRVCRSLFYRSRPSHIKSPTQAKYRGCLCDYCQNINLKLQIMDQHLQEKGKSEKKITDHRHVAALTVCVKEDGRRYHNAKYIQRECTNCGVQLLNHYLGDLDSTILTS